MDRQIIGPSNLDLDRLFPIRNQASARLMIVKAACLRQAGVITEPEKQMVIGRASAVLDRTDQQAA